MAKGRLAKLALNQIIKNHHVDAFMSDPRKKFLVGANFNTRLRGMGKFVVEEVKFFLDSWQMSD